MRRRIKSERFLRYKAQFSSVHERTVTSTKTAVIIFYDTALVHTRAPTELTRDTNLIFTNILFSLLLRSATLHLLLPRVSFFLQHYLLDSTHTHAFHTVHRDEMAYVRPGKSGAFKSGHQQATFNSALTTFDGNLTLKCSSSSRASTVKTVSKCTENVDR